MGIAAHAAVAAGGQVADVLLDGAVVIEQLPGAVALHPVFKQAQMALVAANVGHGHLVGAPEVLDLLAIHLLGAGPALGGAQHDHRPAGTEGFTTGAGLFLLRSDVENCLLEGHRHLAVHRHRVGAFDEDRRPAVSLEQVLQFLVIDPTEDRGVGDFVTVEVKDRQHGAVPNRVQEFVDVPAGGQGTGFGLTVADAGNRDQLRVVEDGATSVGQHIAQLAAFVNRARHLSCAVAADMPREGEHLEELLQSFRVDRLVWIPLRIAAIDVHRAAGTGGAVART